MHVMSLSFMFIFKKNCFSANGYQLNKSMKLLFDVYLQLHLNQITKAARKSGRHSLLFSAVSELVLWIIHFKSLILISRETSCIEIVCSWGPLVLQLNMASSFKILRNVCIWERKRNKDTGRNRQRCREKNKDKRDH